MVVASWSAPAYSVSWSLPLGVLSADQFVEPPNASSSCPPCDTAENVDALTPLPHESEPSLPSTPQSPLDVLIVKLLALPEKWYVASVCVDHVPRERRPPEDAWIVPELGRFPGVPVGELLLVVVVVGEVVVVLPVVVLPRALLVLAGEPLLSGYLMPLDLQEPAEGASVRVRRELVHHHTSKVKASSPMGTKVPSRSEPLRLKYHSMALRLEPWQFNAGVTPAADLRALVSVESE